MDRLADLLGPGLVLLVIFFWLVRKAVKAARTEQDLEAEQERLQRSLQAQLPELVALSTDPLAGSDLAAAAPEHVGVVRSLVAERMAQPGAARVEVLWLRSVGLHAAWCERRQAGPALVREVLCVAQIEGGKALARSTFG